MYSATEDQQDLFQSLLEQQRLLYAMKVTQKEYQNAVLALLELAFKDCVNSSHGKVRTELAKALGCKSKVSLGIAQIVRMIHKWALLCPASGFVKSCSAQIISVAKEITVSISIPSIM